jgi:serine O-acetyltransferase
MKRLQSLSAKELSSLVVRQVNAMIPDFSPVKYRDMTEMVDIALERIFYCFSAIKIRYYRIDDKCIFDHLNSDHYCTFLYFLSNTVFNELKKDDVASKLFLLNKYLHGIDLFYRVKMPKIFLLVHPLGSIIGNAIYEDYSVFYQNVVIGSTAEGIYPRFDEKVLFYSKSSVLGAANIGTNVIFGANSFILNVDIPANCTVVGQYPDHRILRNNTNLFDIIFEQKE